MFGEEAILSRPCRLRVQRRLDPGHRPGGSDWAEFYWPLGPSLVTATFPGLAKGEGCGFTAGE